MKTYTIKLTEVELGRIISSLLHQNRIDVDYLMTIDDPDDHEIYSDILYENIELTSRLISMRD